MHKGAPLGALREAALEVLSPTRCAGCERPGALICDDCLYQLTLIDPLHACLRCGAPFGDLLCTECDRAGATAGQASRVVGSTTPTPLAPGGKVPADPQRALGRVLAAAVFAEPLPRIIRAYKDGGERRLAPLIAQMLYDTALHAEETAPGRYGGILSDADAVTFVPVTAAAFARRGFDHMEAVARPFAELAGKPLADALAKHGRADQRALGRAARAESAQGVYEVVADVRGMRLLVLDDVITTGATLSAVAEALAASGAARVEALALARVW